MAILGGFYTALNQYMGSYESDLGRNWRSAEIKRRTIAEIHNNMGRFFTLGQAVAVDGALLVFKDLLSLLEVEGSSDAWNITADDLLNYFSLDAGNMANVIHGSSSKTSPVDADKIGLVDSAASNILKKLTWANIKSTLKTYFDNLYLSVTAHGYISVKDHGAIGDGITDDITAINAALAVAEDGVLFFPAGTYVISADITAAIDNVIIQGSGPLSTVIYLKNTSNYHMMTIGGDGWAIRDIGFNANRDNNTGQCSGIYMFNKADVIIDNCEVQEAEDCGILITGTSNNVKVLNSIIHDSGYGASGYKADVPGKGPSNVLIHGCKFYDMTEGDHISTGSDSSIDDWAYDWNINNCNFTGTSGYMGVRWSKSHNCNVTNCYFAIYNHTNLRYYNGSSGIVSNNIFGPRDGTTGTIDLHIWGGNKVIITGNKFIQDYGTKRGSAILLEANKDSYDIYDINIIGNYFYNISVTGAGESQGIMLFAETTYTIERINITDNIFYDDRGANSQFTDAVVVGVTATGVIKNVNISDNVAEGLLSGFVYIGASGDNFSISNNTIIDIPTGILADDGDDLVITGNRFISCTTPIDINDADVVRAMIMGNNWYGCTNDVNSAAATTPRITCNIDKNGAWWATGDAPN